MGTSALGHKRPFTAMLAQRLLPGVKRSFSGSFQMFKIERPLSPKAATQIGDNRVI